MDIESNNQIMGCSRLFKRMFVKYLKVYRGGNQLPEIRLFKMKDPMYPDLSFSNLNKKSSRPTDVYSFGKLLSNYQKPFNLTNEDKLDKLSKFSGERYETFLKEAEEARKRGDEKTEKVKMEAAAVAYAMKLWFATERDQMASYRDWKAQKIAMFPNYESETETKTEIESGSESPSASGSESPSPSASASESASGSESGSESASASASASASE